MIVKTKTVQTLFICFKKLLLGMNINEQLHKIQMEKDNKREKVMLHIKLIYKSEAHSYTNTFFYKNQVYHT